MTNSELLRQMREQRFTAGKKIYAENESEKARPVHTPKQIVTPNKKKRQGHQPKATARNSTS